LAARNGNEIRKGGGERASVSGNFGECIVKLTVFSKEDFVSL